MHAADTKGLGRSYYVFNDTHNFSYSLLSSAIVDCFDGAGVEWFSK